MFCSHCGKKIDDSLTVCPNCDTPVQNFNFSAGNQQQDAFGGYTQAQNQQNQYGNSYGYQQNAQEAYGVEQNANRQYGGYQQQQGQGSFVINQSPAPAPQPQKKAKKANGGKKGKFPLKAIIACVLVIALIAAGIVVAPNIMTGYAKDNAFAKTAKEMKKKDNNYPLVNALASVDNLLFNAKSFTFEAKAYDEGKVSGRVVWGESIPKHKLAFSCETDWDDCYEGAMFDGVFTAYYYDKDDGIEYGNGALVDIAKLYEKRAEYEDDLWDEWENQAREENYVDVFNEMVDIYNSTDDGGKLDEYWFSVISNKGLNRDALNYLVATASSTYNSTLERIAESNEDVGLYKVNPEGLSFVDIYSLAADFVATLPEDVVEIEKDGSSANSFDYEIDLNDAADALYDYVKNSPEIKGAIPAEWFEEMVEELEYVKRYADGTLKGHIEIEKNYLKSLTVKYDNETVLSLTVSDINRTKISEDDYKAVEKKFKKCDDRYEIEDYDDIENINPTIGMYFLPRFAPIAIIAPQYVRYVQTSRDADIASVAEDVLAVVKSECALGNIATTGTATVTVQAAGGNGPIAVTQTGLYLPYGSELSSWDDFINVCGIDRSKTVRSNTVYTITITPDGYGGYSFNMTSN